MKVAQGIDYNNSRRNILHESLRFAGAACATSMLGEFVRKCARSEPPQFVGQHKNTSVRQQRHAQ